ncbi:DUF1758 domain-containing protein [Trichonephila clavipes]|nr:DUF1758 domain-containing protein [Trichonephila clavipes]
MLIFTHLRQFYILLYHAELSIFPRIFGPFGRNYYRTRWIAAKTITAPLQCFDPAIAWEFWRESGMGTLIDSASQGSFVGESGVNLLQLKRTGVSINVDGLSSRKVGGVAGLVQLEITSLFYKNTGITVDALILPKIICDLPQFHVDASALNTFKHLKVADVNCLQPGPIDILLGADVFGEIVLNRHLNVQGQFLTAMESLFGWVVPGKTKLSCQRINSNHASYNAVEFQLDKFWQLEELCETKPFTNEEIACENHFKRIHTRDSTGRFSVNFPFRDSSDELGSSRHITVHRL